MILNLGLAIGTSKGIGPWFLVIISPISGVNISNIGHIGPNISWYITVNVVSNTSKSDTKFLIYRNQPIFETMNKTHASRKVETITKAQVHRQKQMKIEFRTNPISYNYILPINKQNENRVSWIFAQIHLPVKKSTWHKSRHILLLVDNLAKKETKIEIWLRK